MQDYKSIFLEYLSDAIMDYGSSNEPENLYHPIEYILKLGGKRIRPILTLMSCDLFGGDIHEALPAASTIEMFHNFTLIHDDIMDNADLRRGSQTVHSKWNENIGILSGDALMILSYKMLEIYDGEMLKKIFSIFNQTALQICEGQQYDIDFETRIDVTLEEYLKMIGYKTAVLLACSLQMGAIISKTNQINLDQIYNFGFNLGIAFQLQDDYLDAFGSENFGKKLGGDILENKKTFLYIKTINLASSIDRKELLKLYQEKKISEDKIVKVTSLFIKYDIPDLLLHEIEKYTLKAFENIDKLSISKSKKDQFIQFGKSLMLRKK